MAVAENVEGYLKEKNFKLPLRDEKPIQTSYRTELDISPELRSEDGEYYQSIIGILIWMVEIGGLMSAWIIL